MVDNRNELHVTKRTRPDLDWRESPKAMYLPFELLQSDAYRSLSKQETDILLFIYTRRKYPTKSYQKKKSRKRMDYWSPFNGHDMTVPMVAVREFFHKPGRMKTVCPSESTFSRAISKLMKVGFISIVELGGSGKGHMTRYRLEHNWRIWEKGEKPCFIKQGLSRSKGFCQPGSQVFCPSGNAVKN